jgi:hypothetical protein
LAAHPLRAGLESCGGGGGSNWFALAFVACCPVLAGAVLISGVVQFISIMAIAASRMFRIGLSPRRRGERI